MIGTTQKSMDNMTMRPPASSTDQLMPLIYHRDHATEGQPASELMTGGTTDTIFSSSNSTPVVVLPLSTTPKGCSSTGSKPIRRRSRASKRTPTTLLNANTGNFRALVQHYTGCPSPAAAGTISFGNRKGPVLNLDFGRGGSLEVENQRIISSALTAPFGNSNYHYLDQQYSDHFQSQGQHRLAEYNQRRHDQQQQLLLQEQQQSKYCNNISGDVFVSESSNVVPRPNVKISEGFARLDDDNISFYHELPKNSFFSSGFKNHDGFF
ncbi:hypothetical protein F2P56_009589 [Juglans regia]|uniref:VQ domain-containing protein n=1 Tax=Juglans regia TaxID=51240 RepID=A0A833XXC2_JUGRE|nr:hypothetical protein F2P56_009589 [Juglans regia]